MNKLIGILFSPEATWSALAEEPDSKIKSRLLLILLMAAIPPLSFYYGTTQIGWHSGGELIKISAASAIPLMVLFYLALVASVVVIGLMTHWMSKTYNAQSFPIKGMVLIGMANTPIFLAGLLAFYPVWWFDIFLATAACCYSIRLLYLGVPKLMKVPEDLGILYASALFAVALVYAVVVLGATVILWEYVAAPVFIDG
jgi:hypothetical protein